MGKLIRGIVQSKRKRADGMITVAVSPAPRDNAADTPADTRAVQLQLNGSTARSPFSDCIDVLPLIVAGASVEAVGDAEAVADGGRPRYAVREIRLTRAAPTPDSILKVVELARAHLGDDEASEELRGYFSDLIRPSALVETHCGVDPGALQDIRSSLLNCLISGKTTPRQHSRVMNDYTVDSNSRNKPKKEITAVSQFQRPPRARTRKANFKERAAINHLTERVTEVLKAVPSGYISICCGADEVDEESSTVYNPSASSDGPAHAADSAAVNIPGRDLAMPSNRGDLTRGEYLHGKKGPQVQWVVNKLFCMIGGSAEPLCVVDVGGGRGDLAVQIALELKGRGLTNSIIVVVDKNSSSLRAGLQFAEEMGVASMVRFFEEEFNINKNYFSAEGRAKSAQRFVVALHACGDLTDLALEFSRISRANFICVPCCFSKFYCTDWSGGWGTYLASSSSEADSCCDKYALGKLAEKEPRECSWATMKAINTLRLCSVLLSGSECLGSGVSAESTWRLSLESFSRKFSMRNMVLCGSCEHPDST